MGRPWPPHSGLAPSVAWRRAAWSSFARWKGRRTRELAAFLERTRGLSSDPFEVTEFILFESRLSRHGAHYEAVASYPLS